MILFCFGTRPEWLKIKPVINKLPKCKYRLLFTGQHPDLLDDVEVDYIISISESEHRLDQLLADCLTQFPKGDFDSVLVQGDTASALGCALAAFNRGLYIYYLEAGLRSSDLKNPYPEEGYRQMIARISNLNFAPTEISKQNLIDEKVHGKIVVTGNTVLDNLLNYKEKCAYGNKILVTLHRRENHHWIAEWFTEIEKLAKEHPDFEFILPIHPNPNVKRHRSILNKVIVVEPMTHHELLELMTKCRLVITDSGGLQEEGTFFNKKVIVCRKTTERPEAIDTGHLHLCESPKKLRELFGTLIKDYYIESDCPYGDGNSSEKVIINL